MKQVIGFDGKLTSLAGSYAGLRVKAARIKIVEDLQAKKLIEKIDTSYVHTVGTCYRCKTTLEPLPMTQWFVKVRPLADTAIKAIHDKKITFVPKRFEKTALQWLTNFHDWNISRQVVWGIRIPAWKCTHCAKENDQWIVTDGIKPATCPTCHSTDLKQETDTFDTWFSSGQWPFATLKASGTDDFSHFYPTSVMETGYDILPMWVLRMIMLGMYATKIPPFSTVYLHGLVRDAKGQKMSKSKNNVVNPIDMVNSYGADALRMTLLFGTAAGNDQSLSEDKIRGMRNFANKLWNISRFILMNLEKSNIKYQISNIQIKTIKNIEDKKIISEAQKLILSVTHHLDHYRFSDAAQELYEFTWHTFADTYIEQSKERIQQGDTDVLITLLYVLTTLLKLLHPFMPFITEEIWGKIPKQTTDPLITSSWPT